MYHHDTFLCRAVCQELAGQTVSLKEIIHARRERRRALRNTLATHAAVVERFLAVHQPEPPVAPPPPPPTPRLKRYYND